MTWLEIVQRFYPGLTTVHAAVRKSMFRILEAG